MYEWLRELSDGKSGPAFFAAITAGFVWFILVRISRGLAKFGEAFGKQWGDIFAHHDKISGEYRQLAETLKLELAAQKARAHEELAASKARENALRLELAAERDRVKLLRLQLESKP